MLTQWGSRQRVVRTVGVAAALAAFVSTPGVAPAPPPKHGLTGSYYISTLETHSDVNPTGKDWFVQVWMDPSDFQLPRPFTAPAAVRVDPQIAFGQGRGFALHNGQQTQWWPTGFPVPAGWTIWQAALKPWDWVAAVIWKGYLHLPKAGTYYLATASSGPCAVYLNDARVALNGTHGGVLVSEAFTYAKEDLRDYLQSVAYGREDLLFRSQPGDSYVVPVTVDGPRDLPIEVRYNSWRMERSGRGIDLLWVTPDSPRDSSGKPVAHIVPSDALYAEAPTSIEEPRASAAHSTITSDFLQFPFDADTFATLTIRIADQSGHPVQGKRVVVSGLVSYGNADLITQPELPTDRNGTTTARVRGRSGFNVPHNSKFFATVQEDLVDLDQAAEVGFVAIPDIPFLPYAYSSYYGKYFQVEPTPMRMGQVVTVTAPLTNRRDAPYELSIEVQNNAPNIGLGTWNKVGRSETVTLEPGKTKELSVSWTPKTESAHVCFKVIVWGRKMAATAALTPTLRLASFPLTATAEQKASSPVESRQQNTGAVLPPSGCGFTKEYWRRVRQNGLWVSSVASGAVVPRSPLGALSRYKAARGLFKTVRVTMPWVAGRTPKGYPIGFRAGQAVFISIGLAGLIGSVGAYLGTQCANDPPDIDYKTVTVPSEFVVDSVDVASVPSPAVGAAITEHMAQELSILSWLRATLVSLERYQAAVAAGDKRAAEKQYAAYITYQSHLPAMYDRAAQLIDGAVAAMRAAGVPDDIITPDQFKTGQQALSAGVLDQALRPALAILQIPDSALMAMLSRLVSEIDTTVPPGGFYRLLEERAAFYRGEGSGKRGDDGLRTTFVVANPHQQAETVELRIRRGAIPPSWKLALMNADQPLAGTPPVMVREVEAGEHYQIALPPGGQLRVASVVSPTGQITEDAVARWAVEGTIGNELIGGIVNELSVPAVVSESMEAAASPSSFWTQRRVLMLALVVVGTLLIAAVIRGRRQ